MKPFKAEYEGTWEEILTYADELAGRKVRLLLLPDETDMVFDSAGGSTANALLKNTRSWSGDNLLERLREVYEVRSQVEF